MGRPLINLVGKKFGKLVVTKRSKDNKWGQVTWMCGCSCGGTRIVLGNKLKDGTIKDCGCVNRRHRSLSVYSKDELGHKYGHLTVISRAENRIRIIEKTGWRRVESVWTCKCDCGNIVNKLGRQLRAGVSSCGCRGYESDESAFNGLYGRMKGNAKHRKIKWSIDKEFLKSITSQDCFYCGVSPSQVSKKRGVSKRLSSYVYNGMDRIDNNKGYTRTNVVPCCWRCNSAKNSFSLEEFKNWIEIVYHNLLSCPDIHKK